MAKASIQTVKLELSYPDAEHFKTFMKYRDAIAVLLNAGVFDTKGARIALDFSPSGHIIKIQQLEKQLYQRTKKPL